MASYAQVQITVCDHRPLLARPALAGAVAQAMYAFARRSPVDVRGWVVLPDRVCAVLGPVDDAGLAAIAARLKARTAEVVLVCIRRTDDDAFDAVLRFHPFVGGVFYRVWAAGYHRVWLWDADRLDRALRALHQLPVARGLASGPDAWPYQAFPGLESDH